MKTFVSLTAALALLAASATPLSAARISSNPNLGFDDYPGYTETKTEYSFLIDESAMVHGKTVELDFGYLDELYSGSSIYVPLEAYNSDSGRNADSSIATDKQIKNDKVELNYKVLLGSEHIESVELVSAKKEKLKDLPAGMYAKISYTGDYLSLGKSRTAVRLILSVDGVTYPDTAVTFYANLMNRQADINANSVYGALTPAQFKVASNYRGEATFDFGDGVRYSAKVTPKESYYLNLDRSPVESVAEMYPDAYLEFYSFKGDYDTFASVGRLEIPIKEQKFKEKKTSPQLYVYEIKGKTLTAQTNSVSYDSKKKILVLQKKTLGNYVLSSRPLMKSVSGSSNGNILRSGYADAASSGDDDEPTTTTRK